MKWEYFPDKHGDGECRLDMGAIEIVVHRYIHDPGKWFVSCHKIKIERAPLQSVTLNDACKEAHRFCISRVTQLQMLLQAADPAKLADELRARNSAGD